MKTRVLLVLPLDGGSLIVGMHVADALNSMKNIQLDLVATQSLYNLYEKSFNYIEDMDERRRTIIEHINLAAMGKVVGFKPDLVLVMALAPITPWFVENTRQLGVVTAHWYVENYRYYPLNPMIPSWQIVAPSYDYFFTIQKGDFHKDLRKLGVKNCRYLPTACNPKIHKKLGERAGLDPTYSSDICFVGFHYPNRVALFKSLREFDIALWGPGWSEISGLKSAAKGNGTWIDCHEETQILNGTKVGLNVHSALERNVVIHDGDFLNPRVFTIAACGAFQLVDEQEPLSEVFEIGEELATYRDLESLKSQLQYFLKDSGAREAMAKRALDRVRDEHTYEQRIRHMLGIVGLQ
jgi:spore maturation protein CgeB